MPTGGSAPVRPHDHGRGEAAFPAIVAEVNQRIVERGRGQERRREERGQIMTDHLGGDRREILGRRGPPAKPIDELVQDLLKCRPSDVTLEGIQQRRDPLGRLAWRCRRGTPRPVGGPLHIGETLQLQTRILRLR